jgi:tetratricopeptide (TPR) repeat protein
MWYRRAVRLARRDRNEVAFTIAHLGYGNLELDRGRCIEAEAHYWKAARNALRIGRTSLAGAAFHDLLGAAVHMGRMNEATEHARRAVRFYMPKHPRFPLLAHDVAFLWLRLGHFSSAIPILDQVLPLVGQQRERILVLASLARCAAAVHDRLRFERAASEVLSLADVDSEMTASSLYHVAEGARTFEEWARAEELAGRAASEADRLGNATISTLARALLDAVAQRVLGDKDEIPDEGGAVDIITAAVMRKLRRQPPPDPVFGAGTPERYPVG